MSIPICMSNSSIKMSSTPLVYLLKIASLKILSQYLKACLPALISTCRALGPREVFRISTHNRTHQSSLITSLDRYVAHYLNQSNEQTHSQPHPKSVSIP